MKEKDWALTKTVRDWDKVIRPIIAKLYREGVIGEAHIPYPPGQAIADTEPDCNPDLYFDFREIEADTSFPPGFERNPPNKDKILLDTRAFARDHPNARFALLRLRSAPHFYPLMLKYDGPGPTSFTDILGRAGSGN